MSDTHDPDPATSRPTPAAPPAAAAPRPGERYVHRKKDGTFDVYEWGREGRATLCTRRIAEGLSAEDARLLLYGGQAVAILMSARATIAALVRLGNGDMARQAAEMELERIDSALAAVRPAGG